MRRLSAGRRARRRHRERAPLSVPPLPPLPSEAEGGRRPRVARRLICCLGASLALHVVLALMSARAPQGSAHAQRVRPNRVRIVHFRTVPPKSAPTVQTVTLPPLPAQPTPAPAPAVITELDPEELRRQLAQVAALRAEFFSPVTLWNMPMPVLPGAPTGPPPPGWGLPIPGNLPILSEPSPATAVTRQQMAEMIRKAPAPETAADVTRLTAPEAADALLRNPLPVPMPMPEDGEPSGNPDAAPVDAGTFFGSPLGGAQEPSEDGSNRSGAAPGAGNSDTLPADTAPQEHGGAMPEPEEGGPTEAPAAKPEEDKPAETPQAKPKEDKPAETPQATPEEDKPAKTPEAKPGDGTPGSAAPNGDAPTGEGATGETPKTPESDATGKPAEDANPEAPAPALAPSALPRNGEHANLTGTFRLPTGIAGYPGGVALTSLIVAVNTRTRVHLTATPAVTLQAIPAGTPLLYLRGTAPVQWSQAQRDALKAYVTGGGTLFVDGATGAFGESLRAEIERIFGSAPVALPQSHPLFRAYYRLPEAASLKRFALQAVTIDGRAAVLLSPASLGRRWQLQTDPEHEAAVAHGVNLLMYALASRPAR